ncbi:MAG TPA: hypothetical protein VNK24_07985 [Elusimicrobiota bacterium]|nr:hypothetical protein [Elusimicrobiota bacterium]
MARLHSSSEGGEAPSGEEASGARLKVYWMEYSPTMAHGIAMREARPEGDFQIGELLVNAFIATCA